MSAEATNKSEKQLYYVMTPCWRDEPQLQGTIQSRFAWLLSNQPFAPLRPCLDLCRKLPRAGPSGRGCVRCWLSTTGAPL